MSEKPPVRHELLRSEERTPGTWFAVCLCGKQFHAKREFQALASLEGHVRNKTKQPCPNPAKAAYRTRADAERDLPRRWAEHSWGTSNIRPYQCQCGRWHFTSQPERKLPEGEQNV